MEKEIKILKATLGDAEGIAKIAYQVAKLHDDNAPDYFKPVAEDEQLKNICDMLKDDNIVVFKAVEDEAICGFLFLEVLNRPSSGLVYSKRGVILNLGVNEAKRGEGIGTKLIKTAEEYLKKQGISAMDMSVFAFNKDAIKLYERLGYEIIDVSMRKVLK